MKKSEIKEGGLYEAKVGGQLTTVRVDKIYTATKYRTSSYSGKREASDVTVYDVTNLKTGRKTTLRSAQKFRRAVKEKQAVKVKKPLKVFTPDPEGAENLTPPKSMVSTIRERNEELGKSPVPPHVIVQALAGTGKTTTLVEGLKVLKGLSTSIKPSPQQQAVWDALAQSKGQANTVCFVAFNKSIATELQRRVPQGCDAMTMHSMGFKAVRRAFPNVSVNGSRTKEILARIMGEDVRVLRREQPELLSAVCKLVSLCKMNLVGGTAGDSDPAGIGGACNELAAYYDIELNGNFQRVMELVPQVLEKCKQVDMDNAVDYDDMIWLPVVLGLHVFQYDLLLVDESQDLNRCQQALARKAGRRLVFCGDPRQAIYGFAGADSESMSRLSLELMETGEGCVILPLTVTRRCGKAIVLEACRIVPGFEAHESNPPGLISYTAFKVEGEARNYRDVADNGDMILCRVNAPLVSECFRFLKAGRKANIQGRDIGQGLISTVKKLLRVKSNGDDLKADLRSRSIVDLIAAIGDWLNAEQLKENAKRCPNDNKLINLQDRHDCLLAFCESSFTAADVVDKIEKVFSDEATDGIKLSSIHRAKGLEAKRVFFIRTKEAPCPHPMAKMPWEVEQEMNLLYVAITRAIEELVYVS